MSNLESGVAAKAKQTRSAEHREGDNSISVKNARGWRQYSKWLQSGCAA